ncbi:hypothetical protein AAX22_03180 [Oenococcus oeni]|nr:hypothetical protein AAX20_06135 [Oenococcus oeni]KMQ40931.1 hypothetical protein AAX22_03180 [Oenococcus oeni]
MFRQIQQKSFFLSIIFGTRTLLSNSHACLTIGFVFNSKGKLRVTAIVSEFSQSLLSKRA